MRPYVGITISTVVVVAAVGAFVFASSTGQAGANLPTTELLDSFASTPASGTATVSVDDNDCFFVTIGTKRALAIWPAGYHQDGSAVVSPTGTRYSAGDSFEAEAALTSREGLGFGAHTALSEGPLSLVTNFCLGDDPHPRSAPIAVLTAIS
jgi:hypothetical protein